MTLSPSLSSLQGFLSGVHFTCQCFNVVCVPCISHLLLYVTFLTLCVFAGGGDGAVLHVVSGNTKGARLWRLLLSKISCQTGFRTGEETCGRLCRVLQDWEVGLRALFYTRYKTCLYDLKLCEYIWWKVFLHKEKNFLLLKSELKLFFGVFFFFSFSYKIYFIIIIILLL